MHHRMFPAVLALAALAFASGCSASDAANPSGGGRQAPGVSAGLGLPGSSGAGAHPANPDAAGTAAGQGLGQAGSGYTDPVEQCAAALLVKPDGSVPDACEGLSAEQLRQATEAAMEAAKEAAELQEQGNQAAVDLTG
ncbi:hypothetical protein ACFV06_35775 [Streptomyces sp. NPDC059618]|uniref:hypothetical protein n=1 Tax=Streptomyces sp. NPDC059618 TaxID=3346887 RepID=UPI003694B115